MTTIVYDRRNKTIGVDSRNTDAADQVYIVNKIEVLHNGNFFLGAGHCLTIDLAKEWAGWNFDIEHKPDFDVLYGERGDEFGMTCLIISKDGSQVTLIDDETAPMLVEDDIVAAGSGGMAAKAALLAGATMEQALEIAISLDPNSGHPIRVYRIGVH